MLKRIITTLALALFAALLVPSAALAAKAPTGLSYNTTTTVFDTPTTATVVSAQDLHNTGEILRASTEIDGVTGPEVQAEGWYREYALPAAKNPALGNGQGCITLGRHGKVLLAYGFAACTVRQGTAVWIIGISNTCDNVEAPPFFGADEAAQRACAFRFFQEEGRVNAIRVTADGGKAVDIHRPPYEFYTPQRAGQLPVDNILGVPHSRSPSPHMGGGRGSSGCP